MSETLSQLLPTSLNAEWQRIELIALCLVESRAGREPGEQMLVQLAELQEQVYELRSQGYWATVSLEGLSDLALDLLACTYAVDMHPQVFLLFQELQPDGKYYPSIAFLYVLLALKDQDYSEAQKLLAPGGELKGGNLLITDGEGSLMRLKPHPSILARLNGSSRKLEIPGAVRITIDNHWNDLVLSDRQDRVLHQFLLWIKHLDKLVNEWGARHSGGPIALFTGSSGTGKTFSASALANEIGWQLYRVDFGALISKYIGETEKNLNRLFDAAHNQKVILQFDEVDALMGRRGEIRDARDRYANMEVSHLLSRIESHQGPCILTTNLGNEIDSAFIRRFHFVVAFVRPDANARERLWNILIPPKAPRSKDINLRLLATEAKLTGGEIRNAALHAAILAIEEGEAIAMKHLSVGVLRVLQKQDWCIALSHLQQLEMFLPSEEREIEGVTA